ncbi:hypothetical protein NHX12_008220 [Muraenolepis orangiensis]|uniref:guanylate cyclase n=1 Tax=Muraenolepis orangiensis TaxID=630683 RepID=A0A9Q0DMG8_9TELE|nr:hypothetical protein NHX12_008220 [Muraenolepis orangiensis]
MSGSTSMSSYKEYPEHQPFIKTTKPHKPQPHMYQIFSALRNLQEKIRRLELEKRQVDLGLQAMGKDSPRTAWRRAEEPSDGTSTGREAPIEEASGQPHCNQVLITQLVAAESRCQQLERQLDHMRRMVRHAKADRTSLLKQQRKICELEMKLQEEEHQRKLVQDKANLSVGCSHSVRANVQAVLSLLKQHQPELCNSRVLEQDELMRRIEVGVSEHEGKHLLREQEQLLLKMERKGEQIGKLYKHKQQMKKLRNYGFINTCLRSLIVEKFGEETWITLRCGGRGGAEAVREYFFGFCKRSGYDHMLRTLGRNMFEFIENLDALHSYLALSYEEINAPSFRAERSSEGPPCKLLRGFEPVYPENLHIDLKTFCKAFPYHLIFDEQLLVRQAGTTNVHLDRYFGIEHPEVTFNISSIRKFINSHFVLQTRREMMPEAWRERPMLQLRGQMIWMSPLNCTLYQVSPLLRSLQELEERHMHIADIAPHDQQRLAEMELSNRLERKKEELRLLSQHLEEGRKKTENLLYAMLPKHVANQLKEGKTVEAGEIQECTILFSDVVTFTDICSQCEPIHIVSMLNSMYLRFDRLTTVHNVYKAETIGDAHMVVGGVPIPVSSHAQRVGNFALGMILATKEVFNPSLGDPFR